MKFMRELTQLSESTKAAAGIIIVDTNNQHDIQELVSNVLVKFGYKLQGTLADLQHEIDEVTDVAWDDIDTDLQQYAVYYTAPLSGNKKMLEYLGKMVERRDVIVYE
jgi:hypothetical protein